MMINWLNTNQGFVMSLLTLIYVIATLIIVHYNRKTIREMKNSREAESRPYVFIYLDKDPRDMCFFVRIRNYGKSGAKINHVSITPNLKLYDNGLPENFLENVILAPSQTLEFIVLEEKEETMENDYSVSIQYSSIAESKRQYSEEYMLTIQYAHQMGYTDNSHSNLSDEANALRNISNQLDSMRRKL